MIAKIISGAIRGVDGYRVNVEVDLSNGLPSFDIVGLPDSAVKESKERVRTAIRNAGFSFPVKQITVNLAPADTRKAGPLYDLPIAVGILTCMGLLRSEQTSDAFFTGELSLDGGIRPVNGVLPMVLAARAAGIRTCFVPAENAEEAALTTGMTVIPLTGIGDMLRHFGSEPLTPVHVDIDTFFQNPEAASMVDFSDVKGQVQVKRALEIAAAGYHNVLMIGPPGSGKTMLANRLPTILPGLTVDESMEITKIYSIAGLLSRKNALMTRRPFRTPHHTASHIALAGGGRLPMPGEVSLAHNGVLFLDELPEFQRKTLEILRQPLEDGKVTVSRANGAVTYPSAFMLLASMNPCPCGFFGTGKCNCTQHEINKYVGKISGPLLDRIDIQVEAAPVEYTDLGTDTVAETSAKIRERVSRAQQIQQRRFAKDTVHFNAHMSAGLIDRYCPLGTAERALVKQAFDSLGLSARAYHKLLKIARTIADLAGEKQIDAAHLAEAIAYRSLDRKYW